MQMPISRISFLFSFAFLIASNPSFAGHTGSSEVSYKHVSGNIYKFTIVMYITCNGPSAPTSMQLRASAPSISVINSTAGTLFKLPNSTSVPAAPPNLFNCSNSFLCYTEAVYSGNVNLSSLSTTPYARDWVFYTDLCCNAAIFNNVTAGNNYNETNR